MLDLQANVQASLHLQALKLKVGFHMCAFLKS